MFSKLPDLINNFETDQDKLKKRHRQVVSDITGQNLVDYSLPENKRNLEGNITIPRKHQMSGMENLGGEYRDAIDLGRSFFSSVHNKNPGIFFDTAGRKLYKQFTDTNDKMASLYADNTKVASAKDEQKLLDILNSDPPVSIVLLCLRKLFGEEFYSWEPDTIFMELDERGVEPYDNLINKVNCGLVLSLQPDFFNDFITFENCIRAMNGLFIDWSEVQKPDIAYICWGITEALLIMNNESKDIPADSEFTNEIIQYVACALYHDNFLLAPDQLQFAQEVLDKMNNNDEVFLPAVESAWADARKALAKKETLSLSDDNVQDVQVRKLAGCHLFVEERLEELQRLQEDL